MKKWILLTVAAVVVMVPLLYLAVSINKNKAEQQAINAVPQIRKLESRSSEWGKFFPRQYDSYMNTRKSDEVKDMLKENPAMVVLWAGFGFSKDYNAPRGHHYILEDSINTLRTGAPLNPQTGPMPTACWTCKSADVPRLIDKHGEMDFYTGKWARFGGEVVNPVGCADCHDHETMKLVVTRDYLKRGLDAEGSQPFAQANHQQMRSLTCAQCHVEYYFKDTEWTDAQGQKQTAKVVTLPWDNGLAAEDIERYYDERNFTDWTHALSKAPMLKAQHPEYETFVMGVHGKSGLSCADCHMPYVREGGVKYSNHQVASPLEYLGSTCMNCHKGTEKEFRATIEEKLARKDQLSRTAMDVLAKAHLEAKKAWELGATEEEMKAALQDLRHGQWRWDFAIAAHGTFFHAPEETLRLLGSAINKGQEARIKLRTVLANYNAVAYQAPEFTSKEQAQVLIGLPFAQMVEEKQVFINGLKQEWFKVGAEKGLFDPRTREGMVLKTSFN